MLHTKTLSDLGPLGPGLDLAHLFVLREVVSQTVVPEHLYLCRGLGCGWGCGWDCG